MSKVQKAIDALDGCDEYSLRHHMSEVSILVEGYAEVQSELAALREELAVSQALKEERDAWAGYFDLKLKNTEILRDNAVRHLEWAEYCRDYDREELAALREDLSLFVKAQLGISIAQPGETFLQATLRIHRMSKRRAEEFGISEVEDLEKDMEFLVEHDDLHQRLTAAEHRNKELVEEIDRRKGYALSWEKTANETSRSRAQVLKAVANGKTVSVFKCPVDFDELKKLMPCDCFQLDEEMLVLHSPIKPTESGASE